jgi:hypothetical protein
MVLVPNAADTCRLKTMNQSLASQLNLFPPRFILSFEHEVLFVAP